MTVRVLVLRTGQAVNRVHEQCGPFFRMFERGVHGRPTAGDALAPDAAERGAPGDGGDGANGVVAVDELDVTCRRPGDPLPPFDRYHGMIMTGSPAYVGDDEPWMRWGAALLEELVARDVPLLAVCFGHQLLGEALGADVGPNPRGREMGTIDVAIDAGADPLFGHLPPRFRAQCTHRDVIRAPGARLRVLGRAPHDENHVVRAGPRQWGLQFHPEFDDVVMRLYLEVRSDILDNERGAGASAARLSMLTKTPEAGSILVRFAELCREEERRRGG